MKIEHSIIMITGASSGIGKATAIAAVEKGAHVVLLARLGNLLRY
ncbi:SDR family NAD(P)-dependent oxidoreductase [Psychrobacter sp. AOP22-C1-C5]